MWLAVLIIVIIGFAVAFVEFGRSSPAHSEEGSIPIVLDGEQRTCLSPAKLTALDKHEFVDQEQGKAQVGWLLAEVIQLSLPMDEVPADATIVVSSAARGEEARLLWARVREPANLVLLTTTNRGTLRLASPLPELDTRDEWVRDVDRIEVLTR